MTVEEYMKDNGQMTEDMGRDLRNIVMQMSMKESFLEGKQMDMVFINGKMEKFMKENGLMVKRMDKGLGKVSIA
jgi:hypothetical protein